VFLLLGNTPSLSLTRAEIIERHRKPKQQHILLQKNATIHIVAKKILLHFCRSTSSVVNCRLCFSPKAHATIHISLYISLTIYTFAEKFIVPGRQNIIINIIKNKNKWAQKLSSDTEKIRLQPIRAEGGEWAGRRGREV
jgi:hypothetical protein